MEKLDTDLLVNEYSKIRNIATDIEVEENKISKKLYRWIAIKLIDGEEKNIKINTRKFRIRLRRKRNSTVSNGSKRKFRNKRDYLKKILKTK